MHSRSVACISSLAALIGLVAVAQTAAGSSFGCRPPQTEEFPTISALRAEETGCNTARAVAEAIQGGWHLHGKLPTYRFSPYEGAPVFRCRYQWHRGQVNPYETARCNAGRRVVTMVLGS